ncbi:hypothetical protein A7H1H_1153 [Aliarcobacter butzleri 7h1h]|uniref:hypothetical protein n=1 Tax=Aliarcobacter butzleri TaxID=28197 RepID=UPI0002D81C38|nr:hypothetical protein [Aliarcobacter butzleri]AGR77453.1 hypothetical protein A7H1H_1153 [Aliarcobacter butzleri 7h1h]
MTVSSYSSVYSSLMSPTSNISKDIVSQNDKDSDSLLSFDELDMEEEQFSALDTDSDGLLSQNEIATAIDNQLSSYSSSGEMPSKEDFESLLSSLGLDMPKPPSSPQADDFSSMIMSNYDSDGDSLLSSSEVSLLSEEEFSALDTNSDGSISTDELSSAYDEVASNIQSSSSSRPAGGGGGAVASSSDEDEEYDELDTNKDGVVSQAEKDAALGTTTTSSTSSIQDTLKMLFDTIKINSSTSNSEDLKLSSFKNLMQMMNNQTNNTNLNSYVNNLTTKSSSVFNYA